MNETLTFVLICTYLVLSHFMFGNKHVFDSVPFLNILKAKLEEIELSQPLMQTFLFIAVLTAIVLNVYL